AWAYRHIPMELFALPPFLFFGFGVVSRGCERQADVFGARVASMAPAGPPDRTPAVTPDGSEVYASALGKVADLNGLNRRRWRCLPGSRASRIDFAKRLGARPVLADAYDRRFNVRRRVGLIVLVLAAAWLSNDLWRAIGQWIPAAVPQAPV